MLVLRQLASITFKPLTVVAETLRRRADLGVVADVAAFIAGATRKGRHFEVNVLFITGVSESKGRVITSNSAFLKDHRHLWRLVGGSPSPRHPKPLETNG